LIEIRFCLPTIVARQGRNPNLIFWISSLAFFNSLCKQSRWTTYSIQKPESFGSQSPGWFALHVVGDYRLEYSEYRIYFFAIDALQYWAVFFDFGFHRGWSEVFPISQRGLFGLVWVWADRILLAIFYGDMFMDYFGAKAVESRSLIVWMVYFGLPPQGRYFTKSPMIIYAAATPGLPGYDLPFDLHHGAGGCSIGLCGTMEVEIIRWSNYAGGYL